MKFTGKIVALCFGIVMLFSFRIPSDGPHALTVEVENLRNEKGVVQFTLYNKDGTIPDENFEKHYRMGHGEIRGHKARFVFENLPEGEYAVNVLHDENKNGKIDKGVFLPIEGIGFSNYTSIGLRNRPRFSGAKFFLEEDKTVEVKVIYF